MRPTLTAQPEAKATQHSGVADAALDTEALILGRAEKRLIRSALWFYEDRCEGRDLQTVRRLRLELALGGRRG